MNILKVYKKFIGNFEEKDASIESIIQFEVPSGPFFIEFLTDSNDSVKLEFTLYGDRTKIFQLREGEWFTEEIINTLAAQTGLTPVEHRYGGKIATIPTVSNQICPIFWGAEVERTEHHYLCIYTNWGESPWVENIYYVHGIYEISESLLSTPRRYDGTQWVPL